MSNSIQSTERRAASRLRIVERLGLAAAAQGCVLVVDRNWAMGLQCLLTDEWLAGGRGIDFSGIRDELETMADAPRH